jgi:phage terminase large subunit-like protein
MTVTWSTACPDWRERIVEKKSLIPFPPLFPDQVDLNMKVFDDLLIVDAPGSPKMKDAGLPWAREFASSIFGAYDAQAGRRLIREFFLLISKKNGKSTISGGIMLTALMKNWRMSAEFLIVAPTLEVANNSFFPARDMIKADAGLSDILHVQEHLKTITHTKTGATLKVVAADNDTVSGKKATAVLIDELWLFGKRANAENMLREATGGLVSRPEGFVAYLSTQSDAPPEGIFKQKLKYFRDVRDGKIVDNRSLPVLYEFPEKMIEEKKHLDPVNFYVTNPNLNASVDEAYLTEQLEKAQHAGEASLRGFLSKHLNVEIGMSMHGDRWPGAEDWMSCADPTLTLDELLRRSEVVVIGVDVGGRDDLFSICVLGREPSESEVYKRRWFAWGHSWVHKDGVEERKSNAAKYADFVKAGELTVVDRLGDDVEQAVEIIKRIYDSGLLAGIGLDPNLVGPLVDAITNAGITPMSGDGDIFAAVSQGYSIGGAAQTAERKLNEGTLIHAGQAIMTWAVGNAKVERRGNRVMITKEAAGTAKIDPLMALFDAIHLMSRNPEAISSPEVYVW